MSHLLTFVGMTIVGLDRSKMIALSIKLIVRQPLSRKKSGCASLTSEYAKT